MSIENNQENEVSEAVETAVEAVEETAAEVTAEAEETVTETAEEAAETVEETAEEAVADVKETVNEIKEKAETVKPVSKSAKTAPVIKKKSGVNKTTLIAIIVCAVVVLACAAYILLGYNFGWFSNWHKMAKANYTIAPHDTIEIHEGDLEVSDDSIESYVTSFQDAYKTTEEVTTGTVEDGDVVHISYVGKIDGEEFEGGTSDGYDLTIDSGSFIDGFEDGLIGVEVGDTVELNLVFPEDYQNAEVAGKDVVFTVTVLHKENTITPEFTDAFVKENSAEYTETRFGESVQLDTMDAYRSHVHDYLYDMHLDDSLEDALDELIEVKSYDEETYNMLYTYGDQSLDYYASYYGIDKETLTSYYGYSNSEDYLKNDTEYQLKLAMLYSDLAAELGINNTDEDVDASITKYMEDNNLTETYSLEDFKTQNGEAWLYMYRNYQMNYDPVMDAMRERVVLVPGTSEPETSEETSASN